MALLPIMYTSDSSISTQATLSLNGAITRDSTKVIIPLKVVVKLGSSTSLGSGNNRALVLYKASGTTAGAEIGRFTVKGTTTSWSKGQTYTTTGTIAFDTGSAAKWLQNCVFHIIATSGSTSSCIWTGDPSVSGGTAISAFTLTAESAGLVRIKVSGSWRNAEVFTRVNGTWRRAIPYGKVSGSWREGG